MMRYILLIHLIFVPIDAGFINADFRHEFHYICDQNWARHTLSQSIGWSLLPFTEIITPFVTGFYDSGWTLSGSACRGNEERGKNAY